MQPLKYSSISFTSIQENISNGISTWLNTIFKQDFPDYTNSYHKEYIYNISVLMLKYGVPKNLNHAGVKNSETLYKMTLYGLTQE